MPPKAPKPPKLKGPARTPTTLEALLDALGTHRTEALAGRPAQAAQRAVDALARPDFAHHQLPSYLATALRLAREGHAADARRVVDAVCALPDPPWAPGEPLTYWRAARAARLAAVYAAWGDPADALASIEEALSLAPAWSAPPTGLYAASLGESDAAGTAALTLLDLGRTEAADAILANLYASSIRDGITDAARRGDGERLEHFRCTARPGQLPLGQDVVGPLLAHGHLALVDVWLPDALPSPYLGPVQRTRWLLERALADSTAEFDAAARAHLGALSSTSAPGDLSAVRALVEALPARRARSPVGLDALLDALDDALRRDAERFVEGYDFWLAVRALREAGRDVAAWLDRATTPRARTLAVLLLMPTTTVDDPLRPRFVGWALQLDPDAMTDPQGVEARAAFVTLLRAGETAAAAPLAQRAAEALRSSPRELADLAAAAIIGGDLALGWELTACATKAKKPTALSQVRVLLAMHGDVDLYWTACQAQMPTEHERDYEVGALLEHRRAAGA